MSQTDAPSNDPTPAAADKPAPAGRLRLSQVRAVFRLVNEVRELGADPQKWRPHMVSRLRDMMHANIVVSSEVHFRRLPKTGGQAGGMRVTDIGWVSDPDGHVSHIHTERDDERPEAFWLVANADEPAPAAAAAADVSADASGDAAEATADTAADAEGELVPVKPARKVYGGQSFVLSQVALTHAGAVDQLGLHREWGDSPFTHAQHRLIRLFHVELARLWKRDVLRRAKEPNSDLPPRLQQTLEELLAGSSEKQIAHKLELSRHTIHNYVKALHQRFEVNSRGELLAKVGQMRTETAPRLSLTLPRRTGKKPADEPGPAGGGGRKVR